MRRDGTGRADEDGRNNELQRRSDSTINSRSYKVLVLVGFLTQTLTTDPKPRLPGQGVGAGIGRQRGEDIISPALCQSKPVQPKPSNSAVPHTAATRSLGGLELSLLRAHGRRIEAEAFYLGQEVG